MGVEGGKLWKALSSLGDFLIFWLMQEVYGISAKWDVFFLFFFRSPKIAERFLFE